MESEKSASEIARKLKADWAQQKETALPDENTPQAISCFGTSRSKVGQPSMLDASCSRITGFAIKCIPALVIATTTMVLTYILVVWLYMECIGLSPKRAVEQYKTNMQMTENLQKSTSDLEKPLNRMLQNLFTPPSGSTQVPKTLP